MASSAYRHLIVILSGIDISSAWPLLHVVFGGGERGDGGFLRRLVWLRVRFMINASVRKNVSKTHTKRAPAVVTK